MSKINNEQKDRRSDALAEVRMVVDGLNDLCAKVRERWPERYPMPEDLDALLLFQEYALARVRSGALREIADCGQHIKELGEYITGIEFSEAHDA